MWRRMRKNEALRLLTQLLQYTTKSLWYLTGENATKFNYLIFFCPCPWNTIFYVSMLVMFTSFSGIWQGWGRCVWSVHCWKSNPGPCPCPGLHGPVSPAPFLLLHNLLWNWWSCCVSSRVNCLTLCYLFRQFFLAQGLAFRFFWSLLIDHSTLRGISSLLGG